MSSILSAVAASEIVSWVAAAVSIFLAGFAIWQATTFFKWSNDAQTSSAESARDIQATVAKLEALFDRLYADTFGMMRDTVADMRKHVWYARADDAQSSPEGPAAARIDDLRSELRLQISTLAEQVGATSTQVDALEGQIGDLFDRAVDASREASHADGAERSEVLKALLSADAHEATITVEALEKQLGMKAGDFVDALFEWRGEGYVTWPGAANRLGHGDPLTLTDEGREFARRGS